MLSAKVLTPTGGETEFVNTYAAYEALPEDDKVLLDDLEVLHRTTLLGDEPFDPREDR